MFIIFIFLGPCHADELFYIFRVDAGFPQPPYEKELPMINAMCTLWTDFVKYGYAYEYL